VEAVCSKLKRAIARSDAPSNPYLWRLVCGFDPPGWQPPALPPDEATKVEVVTVDFIDWSQKASPGQIDFLGLSNIGELASEHVWRRLLAGANRLLRPGGMAVVRSVFSWPPALSTWMPETLRLEQDWSLELQSADRSVFCDEIHVMRRL